MFRAFGQLLHDMSQRDPIMLQDIALKCCVRLAGPLRGTRALTTELLSQEFSL